MWLLVSSPWGRVLKSIREDEDAARALGKNVFRFKMQSLILGGTFGTDRRHLLRHLQNSVQPDNYSTPVTFFALTAAIIGGLGARRRAGDRVDDLLDDPGLHRQHPAPAGRQRSTCPTAHGQRAGRPGPLHPGRPRLMLLMIFRPQGIFGDKREIAIDVRVTVAPRRSRGRVRPHGRRRRCRRAARCRRGPIRRPRAFDGVDADPRRRQARPDPRRRRGHAAPSAASGPSPSTTSRSSAARSRR